MKPDRNSIVVVGFLVEAFLTIIFLIWAYFREYHGRLFPSAEQVVQGLFGALALCLINYLVFKKIGYRWKFLHSSLEFIDNVVKPLADQLGLVSGFVVSVCAGVGEELFFRGVIQNELGILAASLLFSILHFGRVVREYIHVAVIYLVIGLYFGVIYQLTETLWVGIILHAAYDYLALLYFRYAYVRRTNASAASAL